jgi:hypothetical protein
MSPWQRWTLVLVCTAVFMLLLDITVVSVALPSIQRDLRASLPDLQWVSAAYALVLAVLLLPAATLGDRLGRRRLFLVGLVIFTAGSLACARPRPRWRSSCSARCRESVVRCCSPPARRCCARSSPALPWPGRWAPSAPRSAARPPSGRWPAGC